MLYNDGYITCGCSALIINSVVQKEEPMQRKRQGERVKREKGKGGKGEKGKWKMGILTHLTRKPVTCSDLPTAVCGEQLQQARLSPALISATLSTLPRIHQQGVHLRYTLPMIRC
jgi:hypothetical protein